MSAGMSYAKAAATAPSSSSSAGKDDAVSTADSSATGPSSHFNDSDLGEVSTSVASESKSSDATLTPNVEASPKERHGGEDEDSTRPSRDSEITRSNTSVSHSREDSALKKPQRRTKSRNSEGGVVEAGPTSELEQDKDKEKDVGVEPVKVELSDAPIPSVNIWSQRKAAQAAKSKPEEQKIAATAVAVTVETPNSAEGNAKFQKHPSEGSRLADAGRRTGSRGNRSAEPEEKTPKDQAPVPSVGDAVSWPTPQNAATTEPRSNESRPTDMRSEKDLPSGQSKPKQKEAWIKLDFVPSAVFQTPMPPRVPKPRRGGRESGSGRGSHSGGPTHGYSEKSPSAAQPNGRMPTESRERVHERGREGWSSRGGGPGPGPQRTSTDGAFRRPSAVTGSDKPTPAARRSQGANQSPGENKAENAKSHAQDDPPKVNGNGHTHDTQHPSQTANGRQGASQQTKDRQPNQGWKSNRGPRGNARNTYGPQSSRNFQQFPSNGMDFAQSFIPSAGHSTSARHRSWSMQSPPYGATSWGPNGNIPRPAPIMTNGIQDFLPQGPFTAFPISSNPHQQRIWEDLSKGLQYWFSPANLDKDFHLRKQMDSAGYIRISTLMAFPTVQRTQASVEDLRFAITQQPDLEYVVGQDNIEYVRSRQWSIHYVLPIEQRVEEARMPGPIMPAQHHAPYNHMFNGMPPPYSAGPFPGYPSMGFLPDPEVSGAMFASPVNGAPPDAIVNGGHSEPSTSDIVSNGQVDPKESHLSAAARDFSPTGYLGGNNALGVVEIKRYDYNRQYRWPLEGMTC
jgi:la-related protein 1